MRRKVGIGVSAMILAVQLGSPLAADQPTTEQLSVIAAYLSDNDVAALRAYLLAHPELLEETTPLAALLNEFMDQSGDVPGYLGITRNLRDAISGYVTTPDGPAAFDPPRPPDGVLY